MTTLLVFLILCNYNFSNVGPNCEINDPESKRYFENNLVFNFLDLLSIGQPDAGLELLIELLQNKRTRHLQVNTISEVVLVAIDFCASQQKVFIIIIFLIA